MPASEGLRLYVRPGCHLCDEMAANLNALDLAFESVNIEDNAADEAAYGELVPVLRQGEQEIARAPQSARTLKRALERSGVL